MFGHCRPAGITAQEYRRSADEMIGLTILFAAAYVLLRRGVHANPFVEAFGVAAFPVAMLLSSRRTYFKPYSSAAWMGLLAVQLALLFGLSLAAIVIANRI